MGQVALDDSGARKTVRMGRLLEAEMGGCSRRGRREGGASLLVMLSGSASKGVDDDGDGGCLGFGAAGGGGGRPEIMGGGSSSPSITLRDNWRAKSDACHHSRNLSAKIDVGRRNRSEDRSCGYIEVVNVLGLKIEIDCPGRAGGRRGDGLACVFCAIAR